VSVLSPVFYTSEMADLKTDSATWFSVLSFVPPEYQYILNRISMFFIGLACLIITPFIALILYDLGLMLLAGTTRARPSSQQSMPPQELPKEGADEPEGYGSATPGHGLKPRRAGEKQG